MNDRSRALVFLVSSVVLLGAACRPGPEHAPASVLPSSAGPRAPRPTRLLPALQAVVGRGPLPASTAAEAPPLAVSGYGPKGRTQGGGTIFVRFNQPVVSLEQTDQDRTDLGIELSPPAAGRSYFQTPELLVFEPAAALPPAHRISARLTGSVIALSGARLTAPLQWELTTPPPRVTGWEVLDLEDEEAPRTAPVVLTVDLPTTAAALQPLLSARAHAAAAGKPQRAEPVAVRVSQATAEDLKRAHIDASDENRGRIFFVRPVGLWPAHSEVVLTAQKGLLSTAGPLPSELPSSTKFRTLSALRLVSADCAASAPCGLQPIGLRFNNRLPREQIQKLRITPRPDDFELSLLDSWSNEGRELSLTGIFRPGVTYKIQVPAELTDKFGQRLGQATTVTAVIARRPTLDLSQPGGTLRAGERQTVGVITRHVQTLRVRGAILDDQTAVELLTAPEPSASAEPAASAEAAATTEPHLPPWPAAPLLQFERTYTLSPRGPSDWTELTLDLAELSGHQNRAVLLEAQATELVKTAAGQPVPPPLRGLYRLTDLGPVGVKSQPQSILAVMRLSSGRPVAEATLTLRRRGQPPLALGRTDASGILVVPAAPPGPSTLPAAMVVAESQEDRAYMPWPEDKARVASRPATELRPGERALTHVVSERDAYLPGELVRVVGWSAIDTPYQRSGLRRPRVGTPVQLELVDSRGRVVATHQATMTAEGKFWAELAIPEHGALGGHHVNARFLDAHASVSVKVEDFRVPEFSVTAAVSRGDLLPGQSTTVSATAAYFFGGPMRILRGSSSQSCVATAYRPPGLAAEWAVGAPVDRYYSQAQGRPEALLAGGLGHVRFAVLPPAAGAEHTRRCEVSVSLTDSSFQSIGAQTQYLAHAARYYLAVQSPQQTLTAGDLARVPVRALGFAGDRLAAPGVQLSVVWRHSEPVYKLVEGKRVYERTEEQRDPVRTCTLALTAAGPDTTCDFPVAHSGTYELTARGRDHDGTRHARTVHSLWVRPRPEPAPPVVVAPSRPPQQLELILSSQRVVPGDTLRLTLRAPWLQASGVVVLARNGVREHRTFQLASGVAELALVVDDTWFPQVSLEAFLPHGQPHGLPRLAHAQARVSLVQEHRRLQVAVTAPAEAGPGALLPITVSVRDAAGRPSPGRVALWAVDEAVLSLTDYMVPNPLPAFVPTAQPHTHHHDDYGSLIYPFSPSGEDPWFVRRSAYGSGRGHLSGRSAYGANVSSGAASVVRTRSRFETTPVFLADIAAGPDGVARVTARLPDNLTTFRITAVASARLVDGDSPGRFGLGDARVRVSSPLIVRAALPRLLRPGDAAEIGALVNNLGGPRGHLQLAVRLSEKGPPSLQLLTPATIERTVEPGEQLRLPFQLVALRASRAAASVEITASLTPERPGAAVLRDAVQLPLPVEAEPTLRERVATYGELTSDDAVALPVQLPVPLRPESGGLTISANTSLLGGVAEAAGELIEYPYGCVEQTASRLLPLVALREVMQTHPLPVPDGDVGRFLAAGVQRILSMQTATGGFAYWPGGREPNVYASAYATWVLQLASRSGYPVPPAELGRAADYLYRLVEPPPRPAPPTDPAEEQAPDDEAPSTLLGSDPLESARQALAVQVLAELGRPAPRALAGLLARRDELPLFARALVVLAVQALPAGDARPSAAALGEELLSNLAELPSTAHVNERLAYSLAPLFHSETRTDAMVLLALLRTLPQHPIVAKLARGLLERRGGAGWRNTQETAYAVLALAEYARIYERETPHLIARAWLPRLAAQPQWEASFEGRSFATRTAQLPMAQLIPALQPAASPRPDLLGGDAGPDAAPPLPGVILQRTGQGRLYYRVGLEWSPAATDLPARAQGLRIERHLRTAHGAVTAETPLPPAEPVAVDLVLENRALLHYVVVDIPLPAGLEAVQLNLGRGQRAATLPGSRNALVSHEEARRDRALLFFDLLQPGTHRHTVYLRTTTPGRYTLPPAQAEAMYTPEIYGRSPSGRVTVTANLP